MQDRDKWTIAVKAKRFMIGKSLRNGSIWRDVAINPGTTGRLIGHDEPGTVEVVWDEAFLFPATVNEECDGTLERRQGVVCHCDVDSIEGEMIARPLASDPSSPDPDRKVVRIPAPGSIVRHPMRGDDRLRLATIEIGYGPAKTIFVMATDGHMPIDDIPERFTVVEVDRWITIEGAM